MQKILDAVRERLSQLKRYDQIEYWQDSPDQYQRNYLTYRDREITFTELNRQHEASLHLEIESTVFSLKGDAAKLGTLAIAEIIRRVGQDPSWSGTVKRTTLLRTGKDCTDTGGTQVCVCVVELLLTYRMPLYQFDE